MRAWEGLKVCQNVVWVSSGCAMGLELGLGTFAQKALCTVPSSPGSHSGPKNLAKKNSETMVHCRLGIPERRVTGVDARARVRGGRAATTRSRVFLLMHTWVAARCFSSSSPPQTTAAVLGAAARGEPTDNGHAGHASHTRLCAQSVCSSSHRQRSSAVYNGCREAGTTARASGGLRAARIAPTTRNHGCNIAPMPVLQTMVCVRGAILHPV